MISITINKGDGGYSIAERAEWCINFILSGEAPNRPGNWSDGDLRTLRRQLITLKEAYTYWEPSSVTFDLGTAEMLKDVLSANDWLHVVSPWMFRQLDAQKKEEHV